MPNNFTHVGLIHLILPNARIIDVRRHPLACGLSLFKEYFARAQNFSYNLEDIGRYYRDYRHFRKWTPGQAMRYKRLSNLPYSNIILEGTYALQIANPLGHRQLTRHY